MLRRQLADRMLHLALRRGWIPAERLQAAESELTHDPVNLLLHLSEEGALDLFQLQDLETAALAELEDLLDATQDGRAPGRTLFSSADLPAGDPGRPPSGSAPSLSSLVHSAFPSLTGLAPVPGTSEIRSWSSISGPQDGERVGPYQVMRLLGEGGMGRVYQAMDPTLGRVVALKVLQRTGLDVLERFFREARAQAQVEHPFVAKVHAMGDAEGTPFIAMQFVNGLPLLEGVADLPLEEKVRVLAEVCEGVHAAHRLGIIHRDLKPGNVLVERDADGRPHPVVLDFGLASLPEHAGLTQAGSALGTPRYMSPEQVLGRSLDRRTDVYSLGVTFFEVLCGRPPFEGRNPADLMRQVVELEPPRPSSVAPGLPEDLETILLKSLEKTPAQRYDSARALGEDLRRYLDGEPILARPATRLERLTKWIARNRAIAAVAAVSLLLLLGITGFALAMVARSRAQARATAYFNRESERQEALLARTYGMPMHDVSPAENRVRADLDRLRATMATLGREAEGPGRLALGRAHRILGDLEEAHRELKRAWDLGYHTAETAEELGLAKAALYRRLLAPRTGQDRLERKRDLDERYRKPALELLHVAQQAAPSRTSDLARAELALTEERFEEAITLARRARKQQEWLYEAHILEAEIDMVKALQASDGRRYPEAESLLEQAGSALGKAREIGRSAPAVYLTEARRRAQLLRIQVDGGRGKQNLTLREWALESCAEVRRVRPDSWEASACRALIHLAWAPQLSILGQDPRSELKLGIEAAEEALRQRPESNETLDALAFLWWRWAMADQLEGKDPRGSLGKAVGALERAFRDPELAHHLHHRMGLCHTTQALYELNHGVDPEGAVTRAEQHFQESHRLRKVGQPLSDLIWALGVRARMQTWAGIDPEPVLRKAEGLHARCRDLIPRYFFAQTNLADIVLLYAEYRLEQGQDPTPELARCQSLGESALEDSPGLPYAQVVLGRTALLKGLLAARQGLHPEGDFNQARHWFEAALAQRRSRVEYLQWPLILRLERLRANPTWDASAAKLLAAELALARQSHPADPTLALLSGRLEAEAARRGEPRQRETHRAKAEADLRQAAEGNANLKPYLTRLGLP